ncbi:MAG: tyrosinase family protein [Janthinobacterium lividum]
MANAVNTRSNAWNNGGTFDNPDLFWYAKGVAQMMSRLIADPQSWWFYAAIHGEYANPNTPWYIQGVKDKDIVTWQSIITPPTFSTTPLPGNDAMTLYWNQCQHGTWYFLPWHRGYLLSIEAQLRKDIIALGGPETWSLPYWDYFGGDNGSQFNIPPAFVQQTLPDGTPNPLYFTMRYGPNDDSNVFVPTPASRDTTAGYLVEDVSLNVTVFSSSENDPGFAGPPSTFSHNGSPHGDLESNPHDLVHVAVGGAEPTNSQLSGLMADPNTAALDPVFYLHHCNIDRMWASWNAAGNANSTNPAWLLGSTPQFVMPVNPGGQAGQPWYYTPADMDAIAPLGYDYQALTTIPVGQLSTTQPATPELLARVPAVGALADLEKATATTAQESGREALSTGSELMGASNLGLVVQNKGVSTRVALNRAVQKKSAARLTNALAAAKAGTTTPPSLPDKVFLRLENVTGTADATVFSVYIKPVGPAAALTQPNAAPTLEALGTLAGHVGLFGLRLASLADGKHGGQGLTFVLNITSIVNRLHLDADFTASDLSVTILSNRLLAKPIHIGVISLYRQAS